MIKKNRLFLTVLLFVSFISCANISSDAIWVAKKAAGVVFFGTAMLCAPDTIQGHTAGLPMGIVLFASFGKSINLLTGKDVLSNGTKSNIANVFGTGLYAWAAGRSLGYLRSSFNNLNIDDKAHLILTAATAWQALDCAHNIAHDIWNKLRTKKVSTNSTPCEQTIH